LFTAVYSFIDYSDAGADGVVSEEPGSLMGASCFGSSTGAAFLEAAFFPPAF